MKWVYESWYSTANKVPQSDNYKLDESTPSFHSDTRMKKGSKWQTTWHWSVNFIWYSLINFSITPLFSNLKPLDYVLLRHSHLHFNPKSKGKFSRLSRFNIIMDYNTITVTAKYICNQKYKKVTHVQHQAPTSQTTTLIDKKLY